MGFLDDAYNSTIGQVANPIGAGVSNIIKHFTGANADTQYAVGGAIGGGAALGGFFGSGAAGGSIPLAGGGSMGTGLTGAAGAAAGTGGASWGMPAALAGLNALSQYGTNQANQEMSREQMQWQEYMSNTAHQREVQDLQKAGLNPTLSAGGNGSSTPTGSAPQMQAPKIEMPDMMAYGLSLKQLEMQEKRLQLDTANSAVHNAKTASDTELNKAKRILAQKGMLKADLEGTASEILSKTIKYIRNNARTPKLNMGATDWIMQNNQPTQQNLTLP